MPASTQRYNRGIGAARATPVKHNTNPENMHPWCERCNKPVRSMQLMASKNPPGVNILARCHGAEQVVFIPIVTIVAGVGKVRVFGRRMMVVKIVGQVIRVMEV